GDRGPALAAVAGAEVSDPRAVPHKRVRGNAVVAGQRRYVELTGGHVQRAYGPLPALVPADRHARRPAAGVGAGAPPPVVRGDRCDALALREFRLPLKQAERAVGLPYAVDVTGVG